MKQLYYSQSIIDDTSPVNGKSVSEYFAQYSKVYKDFERKYTGVYCYLNGSNTHYASVIQKYFSNKIKGDIIYSVEQEYERRYSSYDSAAEDWLTETENVKECIVISTKGVFLRKTSPTIDYLGSFIWGKFAIDASDCTLRVWGQETTCFSCFPGLWTIVSLIQMLILQYTSNYKTRPHEQPSYKTTNFHYSETSSVQSDGKQVIASQNTSDVTLSDKQYSEAISNQISIDDVGGEARYREEVLFILEDGSIGEVERRLLDRKRQKFGVSEKRAREIEESCIPKYNDNELEYISVYKELVEDCIPSGRVRKLLDREAESLGISEQRKLELEKNIK